jgi:hypothetical protein
MTAIVTLIPAYKTDYLGDLFAGLRSQKFKDFRVVLSDDSPYGEITERIRMGAYGSLAQDLNLLVLRGPQKGADKNIRFLIERCGQEAPLVHIHLDDDVIYPDFYRAHATANRFGSFGATVSLRWVTTPDGKPHHELPLPGFLENDNSRIVSLNTDDLYSSTIPNCENWLGELSNVVLSAKEARRYLDSSISNISYYGLGDVGLLLDISRYAQIGIIRDHLSGFRMNSQQTSAQLESTTVKCGHLAWVALALAAHQEELVNRTQTIKSLNVIFRRSANLYAKDPQMKPFLDLLHKTLPDIGPLAEPFRSLWAEFLENNLQK